MRLLLFVSSWTRRGQVDHEAPRRSRGAAEATHLLAIAARFHVTPAAGAVLRRVQEQPRARLAAQVRTRSRSGEVMRSTADRTTGVNGAARSSSLPPAVSVKPRSAGTRRERSKAVGTRGVDHRQVGRRRRAPGGDRGEHPVERLAKRGSRQPAPAAPWPAAPRRRDAGRAPRAAWWRRPVPPTRRNHRTNSGVRSAGRCRDPRRYSRNPGTAVRRSGRRRNARSGREDL